MPHPVISALERQKRNPRRVSVYLDGEYAFGIDEEIVYTQRLAKGMEMTPDLRARVERSAGMVRARIVAEQCLARRMRSERELRIFLSKKEFEQDTIDAVVDDLRRARLLDDAVFARAFVRDRLAFRPRGPRVLERELAARGVARDLAARVVAELTEGAASIDTARQLAERYLARQQRHAPVLRMRRLQDFLVRKGYDIDLVRTLVRELGATDAEAMAETDSMTDSDAAFDADTTWSQTHEA